MIPPQRALLVATMCLPSPPMRPGSGVNTRPSLYSLSLHVRVSSLAARSVPSCCWLDGNSDNKLCVDVMNYLNFLDRSFEKGESDKRGLILHGGVPGLWSVVWAAISCSATPATPPASLSCLSEPLPSLENINKVTTEQREFVLQPSKTNFPRCKDSLNV